MHAYDALSFLFKAATPEEGASSSSAGAVREASQILTLLNLVRNTTQEPFQKLPQASAVFLAEAAVAALNPGAFLYAPINAFLLKRAALPQRGLSMFSQLHDGQTRDWRRRRIHAQALALAAPQAAAPRVKLAAAAAASPGDAATTRAFLRAAAASAALPASCVHMLRRGTLAHVSACAAASISLLDRQPLAGPAPKGAQGVHPAHFANALAALGVLQAAAGASQLWHGTHRNDAVATFTSAIWSVLGVLSGAVAAHHSTSAACGPRQTAVLLRSLLDVLRSYLCAAAAWHHSTRHPCGFELPFWQQLLEVAMGVQNLADRIYSTAADAPDLLAMIRQCLLCSSLADISPREGDHGSCEAPFPSRAWAYLEQLWRAAAAQPERDREKQRDSCKWPCEPYAVRLLAWIVSQACQRYADTTAGDDQRGVAPFFGKTGSCG